MQTHTVHSITLSGSIHTITGRRAYDAHGASHTKFTGRSICESYNMCHRASAAARSPETMLCNWLFEQWNTRLQSFRNNMEKLISDFSRSPSKLVNWMFVCCALCLITIWRARIETNMAWVWWAFCREDELKAATGCSWASCNLMPPHDLSQ